MIPQMEYEIVNHQKWLGKEEFLDLLSLSQAMPGVFAVNMAVAVGSRLRGPKGALFSVVGNIIAPVAIILLLAILFRSAGDNVWIERLFMGLRPAVVALIAAPVFRMARAAHISWSNCWIPLLSLVLISLFRVNSILVILAAACGGLLWGFVERRRA